MSLPNQFGYERPASLEELRILLADQAGITPRYLAGGTDLVVAMRAGKVAPELVVDLKGLPGLSGIDVKEGKVRIGSLTTIHSLEISELIRGRLTTLFEAAGRLGSWQVRNRGTVGGNLANGAPTADTAAPLLALDAEILTWSPGESRRIPAASFWLGPGKTALGPGEMLTRVEIPLKQGTSSAYTKLGPRKAMDIAIACAAVVLKLDRGVVQEARIALGGAGPTPIRALSAENYLTGQPVGPENISRAGKMAADDSNPRTSSRASREYRLAVIPVLVERTIRVALERQHDGSHAGRPAAGQGGESR
jgi:CO/xanthine dehydrogenase FAD-binding subunit